VQGLKGRDCQVRAATARELGQHANGVNSQVGKNCPHHSIVIVSGQLHITPHRVRHISGMLALTLAAVGRNGGGYTYLLAPSVDVAGADWRNGDSCRGVPARSAQ
jgi:hypothetical protein